MAARFYPFTDIPVDLVRNVKNAFLVILDLYRELPEVSPLTNDTFSIVDGSPGTFGKNFTVSSAALEVYAVSSDPELVEDESMNIR